MDTVTMNPSMTVVKFRYAHEEENVLLERWLRRLAAFGAVVRDSGFSPRVDLTRNHEVQKWLREDRTDHLLMVDADMVPLAETNALLTEEGDVVACPYPGDGGRQIDVDRQGIYTGCLRVSRAVMQRMKPPWFEYTVTEDGCNPKEGESYTFTQKLVALGVEVRMVGGIGHREPVVLRLNEKGEVHVLFEYQFLTKDLCGR
jgi:hypothetical protein